MMMGSLRKILAQVGTFDPTAVAKVRQRAQQGSLRIQATMASLIIVSSPALLPRAPQLHQGRVAEVLGRGAEDNPFYAGRAARAKATS